MECDSPSCCAGDDHCISFDSFDDDTGFPPRGEPLGVEAFVAELAVEAFVETVLPRLPWRVVDRLNAFFGKPVFDRVADELRAVVGAQISRGAVL